MDSGHGIETNSNLGTYPAATTGKDDQSIPHKKLSSSSSSSSSPSSSSSLYEDPFELDRNETNKSKAGATTGQHDKDTPLTSPSSEQDIPVSSMPRHEQPSDDGEATQSPPTQVMERADESAPSSSYRIPASVFARTISTAAPVEWSTASNESLFSIHMGNMSFTRDQLYYMGKSGDLGLSGEYTMPGSSIDYSSYNQHPTNKSTDIGQKSGNLNGGFGVTEAAAAETMREVIRENEQDRSKALYSTCYSRSSDEGASVKSFAFPILTGNGGRSGSWKPSTEKRKQLPQSQPETPKVTRKSQPQTPKATGNAAECKWLSCFSCCSFCS